MAEKNENIFINYLRIRQIEKIKQALSNNLIILKKFKPSEKTKKQLGLPDDFKYFVVYNPKTKKLSCDCMGYITHGHCKHTKYFEVVIKELQKQNDNAN
jgi:hypothetical protein